MEEIKLQQMELKEEHKKEIDRWVYSCESDTKDYKDSVARLIKYGLCGYTPREVLDLYPYCKSEISETITFVYKDLETNRIVGFAICEFCAKGKKVDEQNFLYVHHLVINPSEQHKGYGTKILTSLMQHSDRLSDFNCQEIRLCVDQTNITCEHLVNKLGFLKNGEYGKLNMYYYHTKNLEMEK